MKNLSFRVRSILTFARLILLLLPIVLGGCDWNDSKFIPENLVGVWRTNDARYRGRSMKLSEDSVVIETGIGNPSKETVESVKIQRAGDETNYLIKCRASDGSEHFLSLRFSSRWGGELRLNHQQNMAWRRGHDTKSMPSTDIQVEDVPRPFYEVDCTHRNCLLN
jgi:hypothetical protein